MKLRKPDMNYLVFLHRKLSSKRFINPQSMKRIRPEHAENYGKKKQQIISTGTEKADKHEKDR